MEKNKSNNHEFEMFATPIPDLFKNYYNDDLEERQIDLRTKNNLSNIEEEKEKQNENKIDLSKLF